MQDTELIKIKLDCLKVIQESYTRVFNEVIYASLIC